MEMFLSPDTLLESVASAPPSISMALVADALVPEMVAPLTVMDSSLLL